MRHTHTYTRSRHSTDLPGTYGERLVAQTEAVDTNTVCVCVCVCVCVRLCCRAHVRAVGVSTGGWTCCPHSFHTATSQNQETDENRLENGELSLFHSAF